MSLFDNQRLTAHSFYAAFHELVRGRVTVANVASAFSFDAADQTELQALVTRATAGGNRITPEEVHQVLMLREQGLFYSDATSLRARFGL